MEAGGLQGLRLRSEEHHHQSELLRLEDGDRPTYKYEDIWFQI